MPTTLKHPTRLRPTSDLSEGRLPRRLLIVASALAALLAAPFLIWHLTHGPNTPTTLDDVRLVGPRGPGCERIVLAQDVSGSMSDFAAARSATLAEIRRWAPQNLRSDDQIGVLDFAAVAAWQQKPSPVGSPQVTGGGATDGTNTNLDPVLELVQALPASQCNTALVLISDAQLIDLPADTAQARRSLRASGIHDIFLLVPGDSIDVPGEWSHAFPEASPRRFNGLDAGQSGLAFADVVKVLTRQHLEHT